jgi:hypothetical protein
MAVSMTSMAITLPDANVDRFWSRVAVDWIDPEACWPWAAGLKGGGYGAFVTSIDGLKLSLLAHRVAWTLMRGPIADGLTLDHLCRNRRCCNPNHLEPVSNKVNTLRGEGRSATFARRTTCQAGHVLPIGQDRSCLMCHRMRARERARRLRERPDFHALEQQRRAAGVCVRCAKPSQAYRCRECADLHNEAKKGQSHYAEARGTGRKSRRVIH